MRNPIKRGRRGEREREEKRDPCRILYGGNPSRLRNTRIEERPKKRKKDGSERGKRKKKRGRRREKCLIID